MQAFAAALVSDPMWFIGLLLATLGALGFLTFLRGFLSGVPHFFTLSTDDEHLQHHRVRTTWGFWIMVFVFIVWSLLRWFTSLL